MSRAGLWVPRGCHIADGRVVGEPRDVPYASYWLTGVSAAYQDWRTIVRLYLDAEYTYDTTSDEGALRDVHTLNLGVPYVSRARLATRDSNALNSRREDLARGVVPEGVRFLVAAIDVQGGRDRRFVVQVIGYGIHLESWLIDRFSLRYLDEEQTVRLDMSTTVEHWDVLIPHAIERSYPLDDGSGRRLPVHLTVCDSGGEDGVTDRAYAFYRSLRPKGLSHRFMLVKGESRKGAPKIEERYPDTAKRADRKADSRGDVPVWLLNANHLKDIVNNNLGRPDPGPGYMHLPTWIGHWFLDELTAERRGDDGTWERVGARNEAFDLYVYGQAACIKLKADRMDWEHPRPWAMPWDENPEILTEDGESTQEDPEPLSAGRRVRFRQRR